MDALKLSITQRLTLTFAVLSACVLVPAGIALYTTSNRSIEREGARNAQVQAQAVADAWFQQWSDGLFTDFGGEAKFFSDSRVEFDDWAVVRPNGKVERASGLFRSETPIVALSSRLVASASGRSLRISSVPLVETHTLRVEDLPAAAREGISRASPRGTFLRGKREVLDGRSIFEVELLEESRLLAAKVALDGSVLDARRRDLPRTLPSDLVRMVMDGVDSYIFDSLSWAAHSGQLIAVARRKKPRGGIFEVAVNRVGERFALNAMGEVTGPEPEWKLHVSVALDATSEVVARRSLYLALSIGGPLTWIAMVLGGLYVARKAMSPVQDIVEAVQRIEPTQLGQRLPVQGVNDELSRIAATINGMLDRIERGYKRERRFTGDASHELRTPLAKVIAEIDLSLSRGRESVEYLTALKRCRGYAESMQRLVESLLMLARLDGQRSVMSRKPFDMADVALAAVHAIPSEDAARVAVDLGPSHEPLVALGERGLIEILLRNLIENGLRYSPREKHVRVAILRDGSEIKVQVEDEGPGIPQDQVDLVFERFYRLDASRSRETGGVGLGLSIARAIGQLHDSEIKLERRPHRGTRATFSLPAAGSESLAMVEGT
jgi:two-component system OmpR family sensor kinase